MTTLWGWGRTQHRVWEKPKRTVPHHPTLAWESRGDKAYPRDPQPGSISGKTTLFGSVDCQTPELWTSHVYLHSSLKKVSEPLNTSMNCQRLATFGYDLCSLGVDGHQKNYHAGPDSLKIFIALETTEISKDSCGLDLCAYRKELWPKESIREKK